MPTDARYFTALEACSRISDDHVANRRSENPEFLRLDKACAGPTEWPYGRFEYIICFLLQSFRIPMASIDKAARVLIVGQMSNLSGHRNILPTQRQDSERRMAVWIANRTMGQR